MGTNDAKEQVATNLGREETLQLDHAQSLSGCAAWACPYPKEVD